MDIFALDTSIPRLRKLEIRSTGRKARGYIESEDSTSSSPRDLASGALHSRGVSEPYLGSVTKEKRSEHGYRIIGSTPPVANLRKLQLILSQSGGNPDFAALVDAIALTRGPDMLSPISSMLTAVVGGTIGHRYATRVGTRAAHLVGSTAFSSNCELDSDHAGKVSGGEDDYPLMFQEFFLLAVQILRYRALRVPSREFDCVTINVGEEDLEPMRDESMILPRDAIIPAYESKPNILLRVDRLELKRTSGPTETRFHDTAADSLGIDTSTRVAALDCFFRRIFQGFVNPRAAADHTRAGSVPMIDLLEIANYGLDILMTRAAISIARETLSVFLSRSAVVSGRWSYIDFVMSCAELLAGTFASKVGHPMLSSDPALRRLYIFDGPKYNPVQTRPERRIAANIARVVHSLCRDPESPLYQEQEVLFSSDALGSMSQAIYRVHARLLFRAFLLGEITREVAILCLARTVSHALKGLTEEEDRVFAMERAAMVLREWAWENNARTLSKDYNLLIRGKKIAISALSEREVMRSIRLNVNRLAGIDSGPRYRHRVKTGRLPAIVAKTEDLYSGFRTEEIVAPLEQGLRRIRRYRGAHYGLHSPACREWTRIGAVFKGRHVAIIGSGNGAVAAVAALHGALTVVGHDLRSDMPRGVSSTLEYYPPLVRFLAQTKTYTQTDESFVTSGDWEDVEVARSIVKKLTSSTLLVIDIQGSASDNSLRAAASAYAAGWRGFVLIRITGSREYVEAVVVDAIASDLSPRGGLLVDEVDFVVAALYLDLSEASFVVAEGSVALETLALSSVREEELGGGRPFLLETLLDPLGIPISSSVETTITEAVAQIHSMVGEYEARPRYEKWSTIIATTLALIWLRGNEYERVASYIEMFTSKTATIARPNGSPITVQFTAEAERLITRTACRLTL